VRIGPLSRRIAIQRATEARDAAGGVTRTWATIATVWGKVEPLRGRELIEAQGVKSEATHKITIRWYDGLTAKDRLVVVGG